MTDFVKQLARLEHAHANAEKNYGKACRKEAKLRAAQNKSQFGSPAFEALTMKHGAAQDTVREAKQTMDFLHWDIEDCKRQVNQQIADEERYARIHAAHDVEMAKTHDRTADGGWAPKDRFSPALFGCSVLFIVLSMIVVYVVVV